MAIFINGHHVSIGFNFSTLDIHYKVSMEPNSSKSFKDFFDSDLPIYHVYRVSFFPKTNPHLLNVCNTDFETN